MCPSHTIVAQKLKGEKKMNALPFHFGMLFQAIAFKKRKKKKKKNIPPTPLI